MKNAEIYAKDPVANRIANNGVAEVKDDFSTQALETLRYELETFVCDGEYAKGMESILDAFLANAEQDREQKGVWISGFFGSGKSHLAKMLRVLWTDFDLGGGMTARGLAQLPQEVSDLLKRLSTEGKKAGGLHAASGTLGQGSSDRVRPALLGIVFKSAGLPELYHIARFVMWLKKQGIHDGVKAEVEAAGKSWQSELNSLFMSKLIHKALLKVDPELASGEQEVRDLLRAEYKRVDDVTNDEMVTAIRDALSVDGKFPLTLVVLDEVQQYIGGNSDRAYQVQEAVETCCKHFTGKLLFVATGQSALTGVAVLTKLLGRFQIPVQLSDADVESVIRKVILQKKSSAKTAVEAVLEENLGEISRHLQGTKIQYTKDDEAVMVADYPILPVRRRFWERVLRIIDTTGTVAQLRSQLKVIHEATKVTASQELGHVVAADFIFDQLAITLLQTAVISKDVHETIERLAAGNDDQQLQSRLLALIFLIGKLPTDAVADAGIRATPEILSDLLVEDLTAGSDLLRKQVTAQLDALAQAGLVMALDVGGSKEYRLQTQESSQWYETYRQQEAGIAGNPLRIETERDDLLAQKVREVTNQLRLSQGKSKEPRKMTLSFDPVVPPEANKQFYAAVRNGWGMTEQSLIAEARADDNKHGTLYVYVPARNRDELQQVITTIKAADATLNIRGGPSSAEGKDARQAMETRLSAAATSRDTLVKEIFAGVRVFISGGEEIDGDDLRDKLDQGAKKALLRLYKQFDIADDERWGKVVENARKAGGETALNAIDYNGDIEKQPVCAAVARYIGSGKRGSDIREHFMNAPFGWPQDAIDGALYALLAAGHLKARTAANAPVDAKGLERKQITQTHFEVENVTMSTVQKIAVRKFLVEFVGCNPGEEDAKLNEFLQFARDLAGRASGEAPRPARPDLSLIEEIAGEAGNSRMLKLYQYADELRQAIVQWQQREAAISERISNWSKLKGLVAVSRGLSFHPELAKEVDAIESGRRLLEQPDPVVELVASTTESLRNAIQHRFNTYKDTYEKALSEIETDINWCKLDSVKQEELLQSRSITAPTQPSLNNADEVLDSLDQCSLEHWSERTAALERKFDMIREDASRLLMPKSVRAQLPRRTLEDEAAVEKWLQDAREELLAKLQQGPVIV
ncbi:BREX system P-loop protein BrxC [Kineobactrum sediminis]|uniref:BREX system P-loop protein BrxC n=1 Tax=Kineobactrum sediminis TaxID=1905677 RepID=A0A2N5Y4N4_9GAMM|nr:BREX system P-loop protein BrxC [Kineobactrum sediminis]PLW83355.1 BREX system P-loop protein BrxC [Kineobactrum sediminis]